MDKIDLKLIELLQENARYSLKYLAKEVYLSTPAVSTRIEKLENAGVIKGYKVSVDKEKLGYNITAFIRIAVLPEEKETFYSFANECKNIIECNCITGKYSMLLKVVFQSTVKLDIFVGKLQKFGDTDTQIVFSTAVEHRGILPKI